MNFFTFTKLGWTLLLAAVVAVGSVCWLGCGGDDESSGGDNGGSNNTTGGSNTIVKGSFTDSRDGKTYTTVKIGGQTWMAENMNIETEDSWCYNDSNSYCNKYGRLYTWNAAKTVCPAGWKLPNSNDKNRLITTVGGTKVAGKKLKSTSGWNWNNFNNVSGNGTNEFGFSGLPSGYWVEEHWRQDNYEGHVGSFNSAGECGLYWFALVNPQYDPDGTLGRESECGGFESVGDYWLGYDNSPSNGYSVRCVKD